MKVQRENVIYDSQEQPMVLTLSRSEIISLFNAPNNHNDKYVMYPDGWLSEDVLEYCRDFNYI